jgi:hypothetical protein
VFADGWAECMRVRSDKPAKSGGWLHRIGEPPRCSIRPPPKWQPPTINATKLMRDWAAATSTAALAGFAASLGVSTASLVAVGAAWAAPYAAWAFPMCDGYGNVVGIRLRNERGKFAVRGSRQGIFLAVTSNIQHPTPNIERATTGRGAPAVGAAQKTLFVCEGPTDTAAALDLGFFAVGRPNCCCGGLEVRAYARRHRCARAVIVSDNDKPGLDGARKVGAELRMPWAIYVPPAKDLREFCRLGGSRIMIENTLKGIVWQNG